MYANAANLVALLTVASTVAPAFAAPAPGRNAYSGKARPANVNERSLKAVGAAVAGGIASGAAGAVVSGLFDKRDLMVDTETGIIYAEVPDAPEGRSLKAVGAAVAGGIASGAAGAVVSGLFDKRDGLMVDTETGIIYAEVPDAPNARSLKAVGAAVAGGIASGAAGAIVGGLFDKRSATSGLMVDTETGIIYAEVPDAPEGRSLKAVGAAVAGGIASGAAGAVVSSFFDKRDNPMVDTETGIIYLDTPDAPEARSLKAVGAAVAGGIASGAAGAVVSGLFDKRGVEGEFMVDTETGVIYLNTPEARSLKAVGAAVAGGIASGAAGAVVSGLFDKRSELMVDTETGVLYLNTPDAPEARSLKAVGAAVAGGIASGAAGAVVSGLFDKRSAGPALVFDDETGKIYIDKPERVQARSAAAIGKAIGNGLAAGTAEGGVGGAIKSLFNRDAGDIYMDKAGVLYVDDGLAEKRSLKAVGAAVAGGIASGAAGAVVGSFFDKRMIDELD